MNAARSFQLTDRVDGGRPQKQRPGPSRRRAAEKARAAIMPSPAMPALIIPLKAA
jgi:hypothetical protein